jgi:hypothetical protein
MNILIRSRFLSTQPWVMTRTIKTSKEFILPKKYREDQISINLLKKEWSDIPDDFSLKKDLYKRESKLNKKIKRWRKDNLNIDEKMTQD